MCIFLFVFVKVNPMVNDFSVTNQNIPWVPEVFFSFFPIFLIIIFLSFLGLYISPRSIRFGSRAPGEKDTSPKRIDREGLGKSRTGTRQGVQAFLCHNPEMRSVYNFGPHCKWFPRSVLSFKTR